MTTKDFDTLLMGCIEVASSFFLILQEKEGVPDETDWYAVEFDNGERYSFVKVSNGACTGSFFLEGQYVDKTEVSCEFFNSFYQQIKSITNGSNGAITTEQLLM
jgi:hypothetical protein